MRRPGLGMLGCLVGAGLIVTGVSPVWAAEGEPPGGAALVGAFGLGDGLEGSFDEQAGAFRFGVPAGGVNLGWDSRALGANRHGLGDGWGLGLAWVQVDGGVTVFPAGGGAYPADASSSSGLAGYTLGDVRFEQTSGVLPARDDGARGEVAYDFVLHELGGATTYFSAQGDPVAQTERTGSRADWVWRDGADHRLAELIDADGVITALSWNLEGGELLVQPGVNLAEPGEPWQVLLHDGRITAAVDPTGARTEIRTSASGLVTGIAGPSGAQTAVQWRSHLDGVARVEKVRTLDAVGTELSSRTWRPVAEQGLSTGWPVSEAAPDQPGTGSAFASVISDGKTEVESTYNALGSLIRRVTSGTTGSGRAVLKEQAFQYPGTDDDGRPTVEIDDLPKHWASPVAATATAYDAEGGERDASMQTEFDEYGRLIAQTGVDGVAHTYTYDQPEPGAVNPPIGLQTGERSVAPDGLVTEVKYDLNDKRTAVIAATRYAGRDGEPLVVTGRTEYTVEADGFVSERREFPAETGDAAAAASPRVTRWSQETDLRSGLITTTETIGAGTPAEATSTSTVSLLHGAVLTQTDAAGRTASATYDELGRVVAATDAAGRETTTTYETVQHDGRNAVTVTGPDQVAATEIRDELGRVTQLTDNIDDGVAKAGHVRVVEKRDYPEPGRLEVTDAWGAVSSKREDVFGRTVEMIAPTGLRRVAVHDDVAGTVTTGVTPTGDLADAETTSTSTTDLAGRVTELAGTRADGVEVPTLGAVYDGFGREVATSGGPIESAVRYDDHGRIVEQTHTPVADPTEGTPGTGEIDEVSSSATNAESTSAPMSVAHEFDVYGAPTQKTVSDGSSAYSGVKQTFDELGRTVTATDQAGVTTSFEFSRAGLVARTATSTGQITEFEYDETTLELTRSTRTSTDGGDPIVTEYERDPVTGAVTAMFDPTDRDATELTYTYDAFGNQLSTTYPDGKTVVHEYDPHGRLEAVTDVAGNITRHDYNGAGLLITAAQAAADGHELARVGYTYDAYGRLLRADRGNGVSTAYEYSSASEPTREITTTDGRVTADREYTYDVVGRVTQRIDRVADQPGDDADALVATTTTYAYDGFDKLISSTVHEGDTAGAPATITTQYENTVAGDVAHETVTVAPGTADETRTERTFEYSPSGELDAVSTTDAAGAVRATQEYDMNGNLVRDLDGTEYEYDVANRVIMQAAPDGTVTRTEYWADGSRRQLVATDADGTEAASGFYWAGDTLVNDVHTGVDGQHGDAGVASYLIGAARHARTVTTGSGERAEHHTSYLGTDRHSNTTDLTDEDGQVSTRYAYTDYGITAVTDTSGQAPAEAVVGDATRNPIQYASAYTDPSGRQHLHARDYDAVTMRFDTPDRAAMLTNYAFAGLNPIMKVDPSGRAEIGDHIINGSLMGVGVGSAVFTAFKLGVPSLATLGAGGVFWWAVGFAAVIGDLVSIGIAVSEVVDAEAKSFIRDQDREALRVSGIVIGVVAAGAGPIALVQKDRAAKRIADAKAADEAAEAAEAAKRARPRALSVDSGKTNIAFAKTKGSAKNKIEEIEEIEEMSRPRGRSSSASTSTATSGSAQPPASRSALQKFGRTRAVKGAPAKLPPEQPVTPINRYNTMTQQEAEHDLIVYQKQQNTALPQDLQVTADHRNFVDLLENPGDSTQAEVWNTYLDNGSLQGIVQNLEQATSTASIAHQQVIKDTVVDLWMFSRATFVS